MSDVAAFLIVLACIILPNQAYASPHDGRAQGESGCPEDAMKAKVNELGYARIKTFKVSGNCYEIYGYTKEGQKAEVYFNPSTATWLRPISEADMTSGGGATEEARAASSPSPSALVWDRVVRSFHWFIVAACFIGHLHSG